MERDCYSNTLMDQRVVDIILDLEHVIAKIRRLSPTPTLVEAERWAIRIFCIQDIIEGIQRNEIASQQS